MTLRSASGNLIPYIFEGAGRANGHLDGASTVTNKISTHDFNLNFKGIQGSAETEIAGSIRRVVAMDRVDPSSSADFLETTAAQIPAECGPHSRILPPAY
jgi:hypothetical protein